MDVIVDSWPQNAIQSQSSAKESSKPSKKNNMTEICRLCGENNENCTPIFENKLSIPEKISRCLPIMVLDNDNLPSHICKRCLAYLNVSYKLIINSIKVDSNLRKRFQDKNKEKEGNVAPAEKQQNFSTTKEETNTLMPMKKLRKLAIHGPVTCEFCNMKFTYVNEFDQHFEENHLLKWKCNFCDESFPTSDELITHKSMLHAGNIIICKACVDEEAYHELVIEKKEVESVSSGGECEDKFYIPAESVSSKHAEYISSNNTKLTLDLPETSKSSANSILNSEATTFNNQVSQSTTLMSNVSNSKKLASKVSNISNSKKLTSKVTNASNSKKLTSNVSNSKKLPLKVSNVSNSRKLRSKVLNDSNDASLEITFTPNSISMQSDNDDNLHSSINEKIVEKETQQATKPSFICDVCHLQVDDQKLFELHQKIHLPKTMVCVLCKKESETIYDLYLHKKEAHNLYSKVNLKYVCDKCGNFFSNSWEWDVHKTRRCRNREGDNKCKYCDASFSTDHKLKKHLRKHKQEMFSDPTAVIFKCVSCPKIFVDEEFYQKHRNVHDPECWNKYKCTICNRSFRDSLRLKEHRKSIHEGFKPHVCDVCGKAFIRCSNMKAHRALHFGYNCPHCGQHFDKVRLLVNHIQDDHGLEAPANLLAKKGYVSGTYVCKFCGRTLATNQSLMDHENTHTGEKPYPCVICDKSFRSYTSRWTHMQRHKEGIFICDQCGKSFSYKQNLLTHIAIHTSVEERKYQCPTCNKKFLRKAHLDVHVRIHAGIRPYTCDICNFSFTQIGDMRRHRARHMNKEIRKRQPQIKVEKAKYVSETSNEDTN